MYEATIRLLAFAVTASVPLACDRPERSTSPEASSSIKSATAHLMPHDVEYRPIGVHDCWDLGGFEACVLACLDGFDRAACATASRRQPTRPPLHKSLHDQLLARNLEACGVGVLEACTNFTSVGLPTELCRQQELDWDPQSRVDVLLPMLARACEYGDAHACFHETRWKAYCGSRERPDWQLVLRAASSACEAGNSPTGCAMAADLTDLGLGGNMDGTLAITLRERACEIGELSSCAALEAGQIGASLLVARDLVHAPAPNLEQLRTNTRRSGGVIDVQVPLCVLASGETRVPDLSGTPVDAGMAEGSIAMALANVVRSWQYDSIEGLPESTVTACGALYWRFDSN